MKSFIGFPVGVAPFRALMNCDNYENISLNCGQSYWIWNTKLGELFADYSVDQLEIRFAFEEERLAAGLPINRTREFMSALRKRLEEAGFPQKTNRRL